MAGGEVVLDVVESCLASIPSLDVGSVPRRDLPVVILRIEQLANAVNALSAAALHQFELDGGWAADGALSAAVWTAERTGSARAGLRNRVRQGAALAQLDAVAAEARAGRLSPDHLRAVGSCVRRRPHLAARDEHLFVEQSAALGAEGFGAATRHWLSIADDVTDDVADDEVAPLAADQVSRLNASRTLNGWLRVDGLFAPQDADLLEAALDAGVDRALRAARDGDPSVETVRSSALRADALVDLAAQSMRREPSAASVPDRYRVALLARAGEPIVPSEAGCDSTFYRAVLGAEGEILDVGRQTARWPAGIRRAITVRDGGCIFPGCDRPPSWTDIHHCTPWADGGGTSVDNGALLCRRHHVFVHRQRWSVTIEHGRSLVRRPDGTMYVVHRWCAVSNAS